MKKITDVKTMAYISLLTAAITLATAFIKIPLPMGYVHLGDGLIFVAALVLGPYAAFPAAIGSALADIFSGFIIYAPITFLIKGLMGLLAGTAAQYAWHTPYPYGLLTSAFTASELLMAFGYLAYDFFLYQEAAWGMFPFNLAQGLFGVLLGLIFVKAFQRIRPLDHMTKDQD